MVDRVIISSELGGGEECISDMKQGHYVEIKGQLDATEWFLLQNLLSAQHVSGNIMPIIRSSGVIQMVARATSRNPEA